MTILNKEQIEAIGHKDGPILIIAGAGTGKTTVVTERIKHLITEGEIKPSEILALTFTEKAAREMEERVDVIMPYGYTQMWIMTFHSFCDRILRREAIHIGLNPGYKLMTDTENIIFLRSHLFNFALNYFRPLGNPTKFIEAMLSHFSRLKDEDVSSKEYGDWAKASKLQNPKLQNEEELVAEKYLELAGAYITYEELKVKEGKMDFGDLISNTLKLFRERKNVLKEYQEQFKYILIDEFQDTNFAQNELTKLLAGTRKNIAVVGDDDQSIYRFRGAAISNIIQFRKSYPEAKIVVLDKNYRSTQEILNTSYRLIQFNNPDRLEAKENISKKLTGERRIPGEKIELIYTERVEDEAEGTAKEIKKLKIKNKNYKWNDFAILVRANNHSAPFVQALSRQGIPYQFLGPGRLFLQREVRDLIAYLKVIYNFGDNVSFYRVLSMPIFNILPRDLAALNNFAKKINVSLFEAAEITAGVLVPEQDKEDLNKKMNFYKSYLPIISSETKENIARIVKMVNKHLHLSNEESAGQILYFFLEESGLLKTLVSFKSVSEEKAALNISKFFDKLKSYEVDHEEAKINEVVDWIEMSMELGESPMAVDTDWTENDAVNILTIHSAKGLEFPVVFLVNLVSQRFPTTQRKEVIPLPDTLIKEILPEGDFHLEEERRLFYVGMTRARDSLFLTASNFYGEGKRDRKISPFVLEALGEEKVSVTKNQDGKSLQLSFLEWKKEEEQEQAIYRQSVTYLSYSQIDSFKTCPLQYKYRYILRIPVPPNAAGSFGSSMHLALQKFYESARRVEKPDKEKLLSLLDESWLPVGYGSREYEEERKKQGREMLSEFFDKFYNPDKLPKDLEQIFKIKMSSDLKIGGKIDRIDTLPDGKLEVIDYKTGKRPTEKEIAENLQMTVYALAVTDEGIYGKKPEEVVLSFYFFDAHEKVSSQRTKEQLEKAKTELLASAEEIRKSEFKPKVGPMCKYCDFKMICEAWQE